MIKPTTLRKKYDALIKKANKTDSKKEDAKFREEANNILFSLKEICDHPDAIIINEPYELDNYDKSWGSGHIICTCCSIEEYYYDNKDLKHFILQNINYVYKNKPKEYNHKYFGDCIPEFKNCLKYSIKEIKVKLNEVSGKNTIIRKEI